MNLIKKVNLKRNVALAMIGLVLLPSVIYAAGKLPETASDNKINVYIDNNLQTIPQDMGAAYLDKETNRVMVPVRYIAEQLGSNINFVPEDKGQNSGFLIGKDGIMIKMLNKESTAYIMSNTEIKPVLLDQAALIYDGRSYVPVRFLSEALGNKVEWKSDSVYIEKLEKEKSHNKENKDSLTVEESKKVLKDLYDEGKDKSPEDIVMSPGK
ncbi:MAG: copper amine oxidase N-terminal domain-containing protein [Peptoniphilaceae bacterium]